MTNNTTAPATAPATATSINWKNRTVRSTGMQEYGDTVTYFVPIKGATVTEELGNKAFGALYSKELAKHRGNRLYPTSFTYKGIQDGGILVEQYTSCGP